MNSQSAKETVRRWIRGIWDEQDFDLVEECASPTYAYSSPEHKELGREELREQVVSLHAAFPDLANTIEEQVAEGNVVVTRGVTRGTHQGTFGGLEPTGRSVAVPWVIFTRFEDGRIASDWELFDAAGLMEQLSGDVGSD